MITYNGTALTNNLFASVYTAYGSRKNDILTKDKVELLLRENGNNIASRDGFSYRGGRASAIALDAALAKWSRGRYDVHIETDYDLPGQWIVLNEYSANDMW